MKFVPELFLPKYGWKHKKAGIDYLANKMSFRQTIHGKIYSDRGFMVKINRVERKVEISFDFRAVEPRHQKWLERSNQISG